jgi:hypothetical protein
MPSDIGLHPRVVPHAHRDVQQHRSTLQPWASESMLAFNKERLSPTTTLKECTRRKARTGEYGVTTTAPDGSNIHTTGLYITGPTTTTIDAQDVHRMRKNNEHLSRKGADMVFTHGLGWPQSAIEFLLLAGPEGREPETQVHPRTVQKRQGR